MRLLELSLAPDGGEIHPLFSLMSGEADSSVERSWMLDWNVLRRETTMALFRVLGGPDALRARLDTEPVVREYEVVADDAETACYITLYTATTETEQRLFEAFNRERSLLVPPLEYADGRVVCRILGSGEELRAAVEAVPAAIDVTVERVGTVDRPLRDVAVDLTDRQREVVRAALDAGYYEVPRATTAAGVAERAGCSPSTVSEHLRKAEARLVRAVFSG